MAKHGQAKVLSNDEFDALLRVIDRRQRMDAILVYGGMFVVTVVLILMYMWLGRKKAAA